ncbi:hypothetical protein GQX74_011320 [Glossina fuscipes]|nr:hypothetical protein GQX74_011320 [Glossina fuscipes]
MSEFELNSREGGAEDVQTNQRKLDLMAKLIQILGVATIHMFRLKLLMLLIEITNDSTANKTKANSNIFCKSVQENNPLFGITSLCLLKSDYVNTIFSLRMYL